MRRLRKAVVFMVGLGVVLGLTAAICAQQMPASAETSSAAWKTVEDHWYELSINGGKAGWTNTLVETDGSRFRSISRTQMKIGRVGSEVKIAMTSTFTETADHQPLVLEYVQDMSKQLIESTWTFANGKVLFASVQGGKETKQELAPPAGPWMTPMAADEFSKKQRDSGAAEFSITTIDPENGLKPIQSTSKRAGEATAEVDGKPTKVSVWKTKTNIMPLETTEQYTAENDMVYQEIATGVGKIVTKLSTKAKATSDAVGEAPELLVKTFIKPDKPIDNPFKTTTAKLTLTMKSGEMPQLPSAGAQRFVISPDGKSAQLTNDINDNQPASSEDQSNKEYSNASTMVDSDDALVRSLAEKAVKDAGREPMAKADACRTFVNKYISKKGMSTAFASASETARSRTGDCSEHGVLLAALLRANNIPARVATGLLYVEDFGGEKGIFGWHMWTQGLIDGKWVDLDAVLPNRFNALHILTSTSSLDSGLGAEEMSSAMLLIGNLDVSVGTVGYDKKPE